ncbi:MAG TPA: hypothetical protein PKC67_09565 [Kiritimatiellia bacterium]|nr:hypothetical protein [Kiritimatiellia bacterium]HMP34588.1 hypothetical protein [Kiritimatiellia bacterium]
MSKEFAIQAACLSLFLGMILAPVVCYRLGRRKQQEEDRHAEVSGAVTGAIFALLGLLIAFTFSGAHARFDARRQLIVQEANAIGTTYLRLDLVPASAQPPLREKFKSYATSRAVFITKSPMSRRHEASLPERPPCNRKSGNKP